jgi:hypothetical protein
VPDILYAKHTFIAGDGVNFTAPAGVKFFTPFTHHYASFENLFTPLRRIPPDVADNPEPIRAGLSFYTQLPALVFVWAIAAAATGLRAGISARLRWVLAAGAVVMLGLLGLLMFNTPWAHLPRTLTLIQFSFRLETYVVFLLAMLVIALLLAMRTWDKRFAGAAKGLQIALGVILAISVVQGIDQVWQTPNTKVTRSQALTGPHTSPPNWYAVTDFRDLSAPFVPTTANATINPAKVKGDRFNGFIEVSGPTATPVATNIAAGDYLAEVTRAHPIGRTIDGLGVIAPTGETGGRVAVKLAPKASAPMIAGRWITFVSILMLLGVFGFFGYRRIER